MAQVSGKLAKVRFGVGAATLRIKKWTATAKVQKLEITNAESAGFGEYIGGIADLDFTIEGDYYVGDALLGSFTPGGVVATLKLYINDTGGPFWLIPNAYIEIVETPADVRGLVEFKITGCSTGTFTAPAT